MNSDILAGYGIDYQRGLSRCMNDPAFYESLLNIFLEDDTFLRAKEAFEQRAYPALFKCAHELKGACGNAAMTELYAAASALVELLRRGDGTDEGIAALFAELEAAYRRARTGVTLALGV